MIQHGDALPTIDLLLTGGTQTNLTKYQGKPLVIFFYPKASTPGCTQEGLDFTAAHAEFAQHNCVILGASRDGLKAQENFKAKQGFTFDLIADKDETLCQAMGVIVLKKLYGKESLGIERSTFLFDAAGVLQHVWRKVKVPGHVDDVLATVQAL